MTNHLETTKEAYLEMMKSLLEERRAITQMYYEVKTKVDEIDKLLLAGDTGKVSNGQAAEIMAYANLFNNKQEPKKEAPREKLSINMDLNSEKVKEARTGLKEIADRINRAFEKDLPSPRKETAAELIASSVEPVKNDKPKKRVGRGKGGALGDEGKEVIISILKNHGMPIHLKDLFEKYAAQFEGIEIKFKSFQSTMSKIKSQNENIQSAGRGYYIYKH